MFEFKMDIISLLRENGYSPARIRKEKLIERRQSRT